MRSYREELGYDVLLLVGNVKGIMDIEIIVERIHNDLGLTQNWYEKNNDKRTVFNHIRRLLEQ